VVDVVVDIKEDGLTVGLVDGCNVGLVVGVPVVGTCEGLAVGASEHNPHLTGHTSFRTGTMAQVDELTLLSTLHG